MGNCLVTKLKGSVQNSDLDVLGMMRIHYKASATPTTTNRVLQLGLYQGTPGTVKIVGGNFVQSDLTTVIGTEITLDTTSSDAYADLYISNNDCDIYVPKYGIFHLGMTSELYVVEDSDPHIKDWSFLEYGGVFTGNFIGNCDEQCDLLVWSRHNPAILCTRTICNGHLSDLASCTNLLYLQLMNIDDSYDGNIADLGTLTNLVLAILNGNNIGGSIESFAEAQIAAGRVTGSANINSGIGKITYQGNYIAAATISYSNGSYTVTNVTPV